MSGLRREPFRVETPPRMRGRPIHIPSSTVPAGNTPAYAGKTLLKLGWHKDRRKHPRVCGEDVALREQGQIHTETPPRMRGRRCGP